MEVWDESNERRSGHTRRSRIRRFTDWKDFALFMAEIAGLATVGGSFLMLLLSSLGFTFSGSGQAIEKIKAGDTKRDSVIAQMQLSQRPVMYMVCVLFAEQHPRQVPIECTSAVRESHDR